MIKHINMSVLKHNIFFSRYYYIHLLEKITQILRTDSKIKLENFSNEKKKKKKKHTQ